MITEIVTPLNTILVAFLNNEIIVGIRNGGFTVLHIFFYRQLDFQFEPGSCLAIFENGLKTELTLPAKTCLNDSS